MSPWWAAASPASRRRMRSAGSPGGAVRITVFEGSDRIGGKLHASEVAGLAVDEGAESMLARRPEGVDPGADGGPGRRRRPPGGRGRAGRHRGRAAPAAPAAADGHPRRSPRTGGDRPAVAARAAAAPARPRPAAHPGGRGHRDRPLRPGAARPARSSTGWSSPCSAASTPGTPTSCPSTRRSRSCRARCAWSARCSRPPARSWGRPPAAGRSSPACAGAWGPLPGAVAAASGAEIRTGAMVRELRRLPGGRWRLVIGPTRSPETVEADAVIVAAPAAGCVPAAAPHGAVRGRRAGPDRVRQRRDHHVRLPALGAREPPARHRLPGAAASRHHGQGRHVLLAQVGVAGPRRPRHRDRAVLGGPARRRGRPAARGRRARLARAGRACRR